MVEVERVLSGQRAVEPGLEVGGPAAPVLVRTAAVRLADARDAGVDGLQRRSISNGEREEGRVPSPPTSLVNISVACAIVSFLGLRWICNWKKLTRLVCDYHMK